MLVGKNGSTRWDAVGRQLTGTAVHEGRGEQVRMRRTGENDGDEYEYSPMLIFNAYSCGTVKPFIAPVNETR